MKATRDAITMKPITRGDLRMLARSHAPPCVSLLMPTHRALPERSQDPIRFRNLMKQVEEELASRFPRVNQPDLLGPLHALDTEEFWNYQTGGLAVFRSPDLAVLYRVPSELPERLVVADSFHIKPLIPSVQANRTYYVLHLSQEEVALYQGSPEGLTRLAPPDLPSSIHSALGHEMHIRHVFFHQTLRGSFHSPHAGGGRPAFHGHADTTDRKQALRRFFGAVDEGLWEVLRDVEAPLVLVGVDYYHPLFREITRYPHLLDEGVEGNFEHANTDELHQRVWPIMERELRRREEAAVADFHDRVKYDRATTDLSGIALAAIEGRIERLLLAQGARAQGRFDPERGRIDPAANGSDDPLDDVAETVLLNDGDLLLLDRERMPNQADAAALLRW